MSKPVRVGVAGANGYAGMTAVHLLSRHPGVSLCQLSSRSYSGRAYRDVFPLLELTGDFVSEIEATRLDAVVSCLPHNVGASKTQDWLAAGARVIDMSADFRLRDPAAYPQWYREEHPAPRLLASAVTGLPELHEPELADAQLIAVPGCYATAAILALAPAAASGLIASDVIVDAKSGVSGAGRSASLGAHFSEVNESVGAYAVGGHRHLPEITQELGRLVAGVAPRVTFVPHLVPMTRGILATCYFDASCSVGQLEAAYRTFYAGQPFTSVVYEPPRTKLTSHTNRCLINVSGQAGKAVVTAALDNLVKGSSGQGVECLNIAFGFNRTAALDGPLQWP